MRFVQHVKLCYLADIFGKLNDLNISLQGKCNIFTFQDKIVAFIKKLAIRKNITESGNVEMFTATDAF